MRKSFQKPSPAAAASNVGAKCQKCLKEGHWTADCTNERVYKPRPSRTALLFNPKLKLPEASIVKDDFIDETRQLKSNENFQEIPDADVVADQLIEEVKMSRIINSREAGELDEEERHEYRSNHRRRSISPSNRSRSRSRSRSRTRNYRHSRNYSRSPPVKHEREESKIEISDKIKKKYSEYASDSDFSSESD